MCGRFRLIGGVRLVGKFKEKFEVPVELAEEHEHILPRMPASCLLMMFR